MSSLLRKLTDEEMENSLSRGGKGRYCDLYARLLPAAIAGCLAGNSCFCTEMQFYSEYLQKNC